MTKKGGMVNRNVRYYDGSTKIGRQIMAATSPIRKVSTQSTDIEQWNAIVEAKRKSKEKPSGK